MPHRQIVRNIASGKLSPIYVLHGEEPFFITEIVQALLDTVVDEGFKDFNETVLYGRDTDVDEVLAAARRFPMMADRQLVLVKEAHDMRMWKRKDDMPKLSASNCDTRPSNCRPFPSAYPAIHCGSLWSRTLSLKNNVPWRDIVQRRHFEMGRVECLQHGRCVRPSDIV